MTPHPPRKRANSADHCSNSEEKSNRLVIRLFQFWRICQKPACRRARECRGESEDCFKNNWDTFDEPQRQRLRASLRAALDRARAGHAGPPGSR